MELQYPGSGCLNEVYLLLVVVTLIVKDQDAQIISTRIVPALAVKLRKPIMYLFAFEPGEERALSDICVNLSADMLGMGGAALPAGLSAMRTMAQAAEKAPSVDDHAAKMAQSYLRSLEQRVTENLGRKFRILDAQDGKQKKIEISYENSEDLEALLKLLCGDTFFENNI